MKKIEGWLVDIIKEACPWWEPPSEDATVPTETYHTVFGDIAFVKHEKLTNSDK